MTHRQSLHRGSRWVAVAIFLAMAINLPVFMFLLFMAGVVSYAAIVEMVALWLTGRALAAFGLAGVASAGFGLVGAILLLHFVAYGLLLAKLSAVTARYLDRFDGVKRRLGLLGILGGLFVVGCLPMFWYAMHGDPNAGSVYRLFAKVAVDFGF